MKLRTILALALCAVVAAAGPLSAQGNAPRIQSLAPASTLAGSGPFTLTVSGDNFRQDAVVRWNGADRATTFVDGGTLRATIPAGDVAEAGTADVTVFVPLGRGRRSDAAAFAVENPRPAITSLTPPSADAGSDPLTLAVEGTNFVEGARIAWNGSPRPTTRVSATVLRATLSATDLATPGNAAVTVVNPGPGGGPSGARPLSLVHRTPAIGSLQPSQMVEDRAGFTLIVRGSGFLRSTSTVLWNGSPRATQFVSSSELRASIPASDLTSPGGKQVAVRTETGGSIRTSSSATFTVSLAPQIVTVATVTMPPAVGSFYVGGSTNPERVLAGAAVPLHVQRSGGAPSHWRAATSSRAFRTATWQPIGTPPRYTFSASQPVERTVYFQYRSMIGSDTLLSNVASDVVMVRPAWSTSGITPALHGRATSRRHSMICPVGEVMTGIRVRDGNWMDAVGPVCAGVNRPMVGNLRGGEERITSCSGGVHSVDLWRGEMPGPLWASLLFAHKVVTNPGDYLMRHQVDCVGSEPRFDPLYALPVAGTQANLTISCPPNAFAIGLEAHTDDVWGGGVAALGLICALPD